MTNKLSTITKIICYHDVCSQKTLQIKRYKYMNIKLKIIKVQLEILRSILHFLLNLNKPTDKLVVFCSQQLDQVIVRYYNFKPAYAKASLTNSRTVLNYTIML